MADEYEEVAQRVLSERKVEDFEFGRTKRHRRLVIRFKGSRYSVVYPTSGSDWRGLQNFKRDIKHALSTLRVPTTETKKKARNAKGKADKCKPPRPAVFSNEHAEIAADWHDELFQLSSKLGLAT